MVTYIFCGERRFTRSATAMKMVSEQMQQFHDRNPGMASRIALCVEL